MFGVSDFNAEYAVGNGKILLVSGKKLVLHFGTYKKSFLTAELVTEGAVFDKRYIDGALILSFHGTEPLKPGEARAETRLTVYPDDRSGIMLISSYAMFDLFIEVKFSEDVSFDYIERLSSRLEHRACLKLTCDSEPMYIMLDGNAELDRESGILHVLTGASKIIAMTGTEDLGFHRFETLLKTFPIYGLRSETPNESIYKRRLKGRKGLLNEKAVSEICSPFVREYIAYCRETVYGIISENGGFFLSRKPFDITEMCCIFKLLVSASDIENAERFAEYIYLLFDKYGDIPLKCSPDGSDPVFSVNTFNPAGCAVIISLYEYYKRRGDLDLPRFRGLAEALMEKQLRLVKSGSMPFCGNEEIFRSGLLDVGKRFEGSLPSTLLFLGAVEIYFRVMKDELGYGKGRFCKSLVDFIRKSAVHTYYDGRNFYLNDPQRDKKLRRPHSVSGLCDCCHKESLLFFSKNGFFCEKCGVCEPYKPVTVRIPFYAAPIFDFYVGAEFLSRIYDLKTVSPEQLSNEYLIMSIKYFRGSRIELEKIISELEKRILGSRLPFPKLCLAMGELIDTEYPAVTDIRKKGKD